MLFDQLKRRDFITLLSGAAAAWRWRRQPHIAWHERGPSALVSPGLKDTGYVEGENVAIQHRWAENQFDRLPANAEPFSALGSEDRWDWGPQWIILVLRNDSALR
jgi:hypothetical protein